MHFNELHTYRTNGLKKISKDLLNEATVTQQTHQKLPKHPKFRLDECL